MRWILPLLSLALVHSAFGEIAVYSGLLFVQNPSNPGGSTIVRVADVIDLTTGKVVTVGLSSASAAIGYAVGPEVQYIIAKTTDGRGHGETALAQSSTGTDSAGSNYAMSANLRGRDTTVRLSDAGPSQWPRTLTGTGALVAAAGTDPVATPASAAYSKLLLTLNEPWSKAANASGGTLVEAAEIIAQQFRNRVATVLKVAPTSNNTIVTGAATSGGLTKTGSGTLLFGSTAPNFVGAVTISGGTLRLGTGSSLTGTVNVINGGSLVLNGGTLNQGGATTVAGGTLILNGGISNSTVATTVNSGSLVGGATLRISRGPVNVNPILGGGFTAPPNTDGILTLSNGGTTLTGSFDGNLSITGSSIVTAGGLGTLPGNLAATNLSLAAGTLNANGGTLTLTKTGTGTLILAQPTGTLTVTGNATIPVTTTPGTSAETPQE